MAKYSVVSYEVYTRIDGDNVERVYLDVDLTNTGGNTNHHSFWMVDDARATIQSIVNDIKQGFDYAIDYHAKIEISEFPERIYLFFKLPSINGAITRQYTGKRI